jgi:sucrose phosphorylase
MHTGNCRKLAEWASSLEKPSDTCTYFNFLDSHDGIGLLGARGILDDSEIEAMVKKVREHGGLVSYRTSHEGAESPYELNITWFDALNPPRAGEPTDLQVDRFMASRSIALALAGVPGIYVQSITGSQLVDPVDPSELDEPRSINRRSANPERAFELLRDSQSTAYKIVRRFRELGEKRVQNPCFHPNGPQKIILGNDSLFTVLRRSPGGARALLALTNVTAKSQEVRLTEAQLGIGADEWKDVLNDKLIRSDRGVVRMTLAPYQVSWLEPR